MHRSEWLTKTLVFGLVMYLVGADVSGGYPLLRRLSVKTSGDVTELAFGGDFAQPVYTVSSQDSGTSIVIDVRKVGVTAAGIKRIGESPLVKNVTTELSGQGLRLIVQTSEEVAYRVRALPGVLKLAIEPASKTGPRESVPTLAAQPALAASVGADSEKLPRATSVVNVATEQRDGRDRVVLELDGVANFQVEPGTESPARLRLYRVKVGASAQRKLSPVGLPVIGNIELHQDAEGVTVEVTHKDSAFGTAVREGRRIVWLFAPGGQKSSRPSAQTLAKEAPLELPEIIHGSSETSPFVTGSPAAIAAGRKANYSGRRIDLDLKDADIHDILRLISEVGKVNVVTSDDVKGSVTLRMLNVPWDQALDVILQSKSLGMIRKDNMIRVAPLEQLEKEREAAIARKKQNLELAPLETRLIPVSYATAEKIKPRVAELLSTRGTVSTDERTNVLIVRDLTENLDEVEALVRTLDTQTPQVLVEARVVEATSQYSRDIGIQWGGAFTAAQASGNPTGLVFPSNIGIAGGNYSNDSLTQGLSPFTNRIAVPNYAVNLPATNANGAGGALGLTLGSVDSTLNLNVRLSAAESNGIVRIISAPRVLTLDNHEAHIAQGTLIPYSQVSAQGVQTAFQEAKLQLIVRPHVTSDASVSMHVKVTRDEPDFTRVSVRGDPTILKREAETDLLVADSHTAVIGGIFTRNSGRTINQVPFFGDIPIIGVLFQRRLVQDNRNELLIFLTPRIVNRNEALRN